jgi:ribosomal protein L11 methyltransferase
VGCGSGILSIVASKLGGDVSSCDIDEEAIKVSKENFSKNNIKSNKLYLGSVHNHTKKYDIILANLVSDVIIALSSDFRSILKDNSFIILSGILYKNKDKVLKKYDFLDCVKQIVSKDGDWITLILRNIIEK